MDLSGQVDITVYTTSGESCYINTLDNWCDNYEKGRLDTFSGEDLQGCNMFEVPGADILILSIQHFGLDAWKPEYIRSLIIYSEICLVHSCYQLNIAGFTLMMETESTVQSIL